MTDFNWPGARQSFKGIDDLKSRYAVLEREKYEGLEARKWYELLEWIDQVRLAYSSQQELERVLQEAYAKAKAKISDHEHEWEYATLLRARGGDLLLFFVKKYPHLKGALLRGEGVERPASVPPVIIAQTQTAPLTDPGTATAQQTHEPTETPTSKKPYTFGPGYRSVDWYGQPYSFGPTEAPIVEILAVAYEAGTPDVDAGALLGLSNDERKAKGKKESHAHRVRDIFRKNPAWRTMIQPGKGRGKKGTYHLQPPTTAS